MLTRYQLISHPWSVELTVQGPDRSWDKIVAFGVGEFLAEEPAYPRSFCTNVNSFTTTVSCISIAYTLTVHTYVHLFIYMNRWIELVSEDDIAVLDSEVTLTDVHAELGKSALHNYEW